jgi:uncharacterized membrane protein YphA (DoxX/SURF4 family)
LLLFCAPVLTLQSSLSPVIGGALSLDWNSFLLWVGRHVLGIRGAIPTAETGSGDRSIDWIRLFCFAALALLVTILWSVLPSWRARRRREHERLHRFLRIVVRYTLGLVMLGYGVGKLVGGQFPPPGAGRLLQTYGDSSPMGLLWTFMGASPAYVVFAGAGETLGALLVLFRRTTTLGALVLVAVLTNVVMLNFCYDVPVKINSTHYLAMSLFLLLPDLRRLSNVLLFDRPTEPAPAAPDFRRRWMRIAFPIAKGAALVLLMSLVAVSTHSRMAAYRRGFDATDPGAPLLVRRGFHWISEAPFNR